MSDYDNRVTIECTCAMTEAPLLSCAVHGEKRPPNEVTVNADGCSCPGYCRSCGRSESDVACPIHGQALKAGDGNVLIVHPDDTYSLIEEPA